MCCYILLGNGGASTEIYSIVFFVIGEHIFGRKPLAIAIAMEIRLEKKRAQSKIRRTNDYWVRVVFVPVCDKKKTKFPEIVTKK